jgi:hypothetical protein
MKACVLIGAAVAVAAMAAPAPCRAADSLPGGPGISVRHGVVYRGGKPYRGFGINVRDLADEVLDKGAAAKDSLECIRWLGEQKVPFIRFWASYFNNYKKFLDDPARYWKNMDLLVDAAEKANVGLMPTLFWCSWDVPSTFEEFRCDWIDEQSRTRKFMERYTREFITRYGKRPAVWFYEFSNENNLDWDLPNMMEFLPPGQHDARNIARFYVGREAIRSFARTVRKYDPHRAISSGCSNPRGSQYHLATVAPDKDDIWASDTPEQTVIAAGWTAPEPVDLVSMHYYTPFVKYDAIAVRDEIKRDMRIAAKLGKPLYLGEFGMLDGNGDTIVPDFNDALYKQRMRELFETIYEAKVPLASYWVYSVQRFGFAQGAVNPNFGRFDYVVELIREYNAKIAARAPGD